MALSGSVTTNVVTAYGLTTSFTFSWSATQNATANQSTVTWTLTTVQSPDGSGYKRGVRHAIVTIDGTSRFDTTWNYDSMYQVSNGTQVANGQVTLTHAANGTKSFAVNIQISVGQQVATTYTHTRSQTFTLNTITPSATSNGVSLKLSDNNYWDSKNVAVKFNGNRYILNDVQYDFQATTAMFKGTEGNISWGGGTDTAGFHDYTISFPRAFSTKPIVVLCNSRYDCKRAYASYSIHIISGSITTAGFKARVFRTGHNKGVNGFNISYIAIIPKSTTFVNASKEMVGTNTISKISTGTAVKLSDNNYWSLDSIIDSRDTNHNTVHNTYYTMDHGHGVYTVPSQSNVDASGTELYPLYSKHFCGPAKPVTVASFYQITGDGSSNFNLGTNGGNIYLDCTSNSIAAGNDLNYKGFYLGLMNRTGVSLKLGVSWIAIGRAEK